MNTSAATCHRRLQALFAGGVVRAVRALIDPTRVGRGTLVMVGIVLDRSTPESFAAFETAVRGSRPCSTATSWPAISTTS